MAKRDNIVAECDILRVAAVFAADSAYSFGAKP
jgi:hypothetical protein